MTFFSNLSLVSNFPPFPPTFGRNFFVGQEGSFYNLFTPYSPPFPLIPLCNFFPGKFKNFLSLPFPPLLILRPILPLLLHFFLTSPPQWPSLPHSCVETAPLTAPRAAVHDSHLNTAVSFPLTTRTQPQPLLHSNHTPPPLHIVCGRNPRGTKDLQKPTKPDPFYQNCLVTLFINRIVKNGKKSLAFQILYRALKRILMRTESNPLVVLRDAVNSVIPDATVKSRRVGGSTHQIPVEIGAAQGKALAIRLLLDAAKKQHGKSMVDKLSVELMDASKGNGEAVKQKESTHKIAEANRAFARFR